MAARMRFLAMLLESDFFFFADVFRDGIVWLYIPYKKNGACTSPPTSLSHLQKMFSLQPAAGAAKVLHLDGACAWCTPPSNVSASASKRGLRAEELVCARVLLGGVRDGVRSCTQGITLGQAIAWLVDNGARVGVHRDGGGGWCVPWHPLRLHEPTAMRRHHEETESALWLCVHDFALPEGVRACDDESVEWVSVATNVRAARAREGGERRYRNGILEARVAESPYHVWVDSPDDEPLPDDAANTAFLSRLLLQPEIAHEAGAVVRALARRAVRWRGALEWQDGGGSMARTSAHVVRDERVSDELLALCRTPHLVRHSRFDNWVYHLAYATVHRVETAMRDEDVSLAARRKGVECVKTLVGVSAAHFARLNSLGVMNDDPNVQGATSSSLLCGTTWYFPEHVDASHMVKAAAELFDMPQEDVCAHCLEDEYVLALDEWKSEVGALGVMLPAATRTAWRELWPVRFYHVRVEEHGVVLERDLETPVPHCQTARRALVSLESFRDKWLNGAPQSALRASRRVATLFPSLARRMEAAREAGRAALLEAAVAELARRRVSVEWTLEQLDEEEDASASSLGLSVWACVVFGHVLGARVRLVMDQSMGACVAVRTSRDAAAFLDPVRTRSKLRRRFPKAVESVETLRVGALVEERRRTHWRAALVTRLRPDMDCVWVEYLDTGESGLLRQGRVVRLIADADEDLAKQLRRLRSGAAKKRERDEEEADEQAYEQAYEQAGKEVGVR